ncbi:hypothetical protein CLV78_102576 [Aliiruegeria haliotis]|uniref:Uncharacterized protein n=1 Tax=Aliiruegeria haliotis TaxID=1280846 RepID=A0A2T0RW69_9RHOB|nr:hypothetical protein CLV78_102576 [Aliiruegeria haliotis]
MHCWAEIPEARSPVAGRRRGGPIGAALSENWNLFLVAATFRKDVAVIFLCVRVTARAGDHRRRFVVPLCFTLSDASALPARCGRASGPVSLPHPYATARKAVGHPTKGNVVHPESEMVVVSTRTDIQAARFGQGNRDTGREVGGDLFDRPVPWSLRMRGTSLPLPPVFGEVGAANPDEHPTRPAFSGNPSAKGHYA